MDASRASASSKSELPAGSLQSDSLDDMVGFGIDHPVSSLTEDVFGDIKRVGKLFCKPNGSYRGMDKVKVLVKDFPFKYKLTDKDFKPQKWVRRTFKRADGLTIEKWHQADDNEEVEFPEYGEHKNDDMFSVLQSLTKSEFDTMNRGKYIWSWDETMYLIDMCRKYDFSWVLISDRYKFQNQPRRPVIEVKAHIHNIYNCICIFRKQPELAIDYSPSIDKYNRASVKAYLNQDPESIVHLDELLSNVENFDMDIYKRKAEMDTAAAAAATAAALAEQAASAAASAAALVSSARSSSSRPASRMSSTSRAGPRSSESVTDWNKKIEAAMDTSILRFFNNQTNGPHMQSQEFRLQSNVNVKKKSNIDFVIDRMQKQIGVIRPTHTKEMSELCMKLSFYINQVTELKTVYNNAYAELVALNNELKDKTGQEEDISDIPPMRQAYDDNQPSLLPYIELPENPLNAIAPRRR